MKKIIYPLLFLLFFVEGISRGNTQNLMASDISWTCVGQDSFLIKLVVYRDCNGYSLSNTPITFKCAASGTTITSITPNPGTEVDVTPVCNTSCTRCQYSGCSFPYGINRSVIQGIVKLNSAGTCCNINISWLQCCRNNAITNLATTTPDFYTEATLNRCQNPCDNSPTFSYAPISILCVGLPYNFNNGIRDIDVNNTGGLADSFTYEWAQPMSAATTNLSYNGQYAYNKPIYFWGFPNDGLPFPRGLHLDSQTGDIQYQPMKAEVTVMVVQVNEFRNGVKIAQLRCEMQIIVINCTANNPPSITTPNNIRSKSVCEGDTVTFNFSTNDPNANDTVTISYNNAIPGGIWTNSNGYSKHPTASLKWVPTSSRIGNLPYTFSVTARDNVCPVNASFTQAYQITVKPKPQASYSDTNLGCGWIRFKARGIIGSGPSYSWQSKSFLYSPIYASDIDQKFQPGIYPYTMTVTAGGCSTTYFDTFSIISDSFIVVRLPADTSVCIGSSISISPRIYFGKEPIKYLWNNGDTNRILHFGPIAHIEAINLTVWDSNGCNSASSRTILVLKNPEITASNPIDICYTGNYNVEISPAYQLFGVNNYVANFNWHKLGDTVILSGLPVLNTRDTGLFVFTIEDKFGCSSSDSFTIANSVKKPQITLIDKVRICYNDNIPIIITPIYKVFGNNYISAFNWQRSGDTAKLSDTNVLNTKDTGIYKITIADKFGCEASDSIKFEFTPHIDTSLLVNGSVLTATAGMRKYIWFVNDSLIYSGATNVLDAMIDGSYYVCIYDFHGCVDTSRTVIMMLTDMKNKGLDGIIKLYPNPTTGKLVLEVNKQVTGDINLTLFNIYGKEILNQTFKSNDIQSVREIDVSDQPAGTYTVIIRYQNTNFHQLMIKE